MHPPMHSLLSLWRVSVLCLLLVGILGHCYGSTFANRIMARDDDNIYVYVISNMPQTAVMQAICRNLLLRVDKGKPHCTYVPLSSVGTYGRKKNELLPYKHLEDNETIIVIDRSQMTEQDTAGLQKLQTELFQAMPERKHRNSVRIWVQNYGKTKRGREYQVLVDIPQTKWLERAADDLWNDKWGAFYSDKTRQSFNHECPIDAGAILTNDPDSAEAISASMPYCEMAVFDLDGIDEFQARAGLTKRFIILNWNGETECPAAQIKPLLPPSMKQYYEIKTDRVGLTGWQQFCRTPMVRCEMVGETEVWAICAPTEKYLRKMTGLVLQDKFRKDAYTFNVTDFSYINRLAVGVYVSDSSLKRDRLVMQQRLEEAATDVLRLQIQSMVSVTGWGKILDNVLDRNNPNDDPLNNPETIRRINQASNADALLLLWVNELKPSIAYDKNYSRTTPPYKDWSQAAREADVSVERPKEPEKPTQHDPDDKEGPIWDRDYKYKGKTREERANDPVYLADVRKYYDKDIPKYNREYNEWRKEAGAWDTAKYRWERGRESYEVHFNYYARMTPGTGVVADIRIIDTVKEQSLLTAPIPVSLGRTGQSREVLEIPVSLTGEDSIPDMPNAITRFQNVYTWPGCFDLVGEDTMYAICQDAITASLREGLMKLPEFTLWAADLKPWNLPSARPVRPELPPARVTQPETPDPLNSRNTTTTTSTTSEPVQPQKAVEEVKQPETTTNTGTTAMHTGTVTLPPPPPVTTDQTEETTPTVVTLPSANTTYRSNGMLMIPVNGLALWLGATKGSDAKTGYIKYSLKNRTIEVKPGSQTAKINGNQFTMDRSMEVRNDVGYVPLSFMEIAFLLQGTVNLENGTLTLMTMDNDAGALLTIVK
ncbi:MAG: copper amine oxidase N-terminal domain-containing protein [Armatimonadota bacterium]